MDDLTPILLGLVVLLLVWNLALTLLYLAQQKFFSQLTQDISKKDLKTILKNISNSLKSINSDIQSLEDTTDKIKLANRTHLQKVGFVRFNPFADTGGDQSFCICLLDQNDTGTIITSLHSREQTRIYAKTIIQGKGENTTFFEEEKQALKLALSYNRKESQPSEAK